MPALDILERQERERLSRMTLKQASDAVMRGLYTLDEIAKFNHSVKVMRPRLESNQRVVGWKPPLLIDPHR